MFGRPPTSSAANRPTSRVGRNMVLAPGPPKTGVPSPMPPGTTSGNQFGPPSTAILRPITGIKERPVTQQGVGAPPKTGLHAANKGRLVQDRQYWIGEIKQRMALVDMEARKVQSDCDSFEKDSASLAHLEKRAQQVNEELRELQGQLGDYNTLIDKIHTDADLEDIQRQTHELNMKNTRQQSSVDALFVRRQLAEKNIREIEDQIKEELDKLNTHMMQNTSSDVQHEWTQLDEENRVVQADIAKQQLVLNKISAQHKQAKEELERDTFKAKVWRIQRMKKRMEEDVRLLRSGCDAKNRIEKDNNNQSKEPGKSEGLQASTLKSKKSLIAVQGQSTLEPEKQANSLISREYRYGYDDDLEASDQSDFTDPNEEDGVLKQDKKDNIADPTAFSSGAKGKAIDGSETSPLSTVTEEAKKLAAARKRAKDLQKRIALLETKEAILELIRQANKEIEDLSAQHADLEKEHAKYRKQKEAIESADRDSRKDLSANADAEDGSAGKSAKRDEDERKAKYEELQRKEREMDDYMAQAELKEKEIMSRITTLRTEIEKHMDDAAKFKQQIEAITKFKGGDAATSEIAPGSKGASSPTSACNKDDAQDQQAELRQMARDMAAKEREAQQSVETEVGVRQERERLESDLRGIEKLEERVRSEIDAIKERIAECRTKAKEYGDIDGKEDGENSTPQRAWRERVAILEAQKVELGARRQQLEGEASSARARTEEQRQRVSRWREQLLAGNDVFSELEAAEARCKEASEAATNARAAVEEHQAREATYSEQRRHVIAQVAAAAAEASMADPPAYR